MNKKKQECCSGCKSREHIIQEIHWMARRYAHGRATYVVSMFNDAIRLGQSLGMEFKPDPIDGLIEAKDAQLDRDWFEKKQTKQNQVKKGCGYEPED